MRWTSEQEEKLIELSKTHTIKEIASIMNLTPGAVRLKGKKFDIKFIKDTSHCWSEEQNELFLELSKTHNVKEIASIMNIKPKSVIRKAKRLNIKLIMDHNLWTDEELRYLKENWGIKKFENIVKHLNKTQNAVINMARRLKLGSMYDADKEILRVKDISNILQIHENTIREWFNHGLSYEIREVSEHASYKYVTWTEFLRFLRNNLDKWDSRNVDLYMLGEEYDWLKEKRKQDEINPIQRKRLWTLKEVIMAIKLVDKGKSYEEIGKILDRSPDAVARILQQAGHGINQDCFWLDEDTQYLIEKYPNTTANEIALDLGKTEGSVRGKIVQLGIQKTKKLTKNNI